jgi:diguanylate cyclase (GGDEF)-like protein
MLAKPRSLVSPTTPPIQNLTILFIDDSLYDLNYFGGMISDLCKVHFASSAAGAFNLVKSGLQPDLLIVDLYMPQKNGLEVLEELVANYHLTQTRIVVLSNENDIYWKLQSFSCGVHDYILKSIEKEEFICRIKFHLIEQNKLITLSRRSYFDTLTNVANRATVNTAIENYWHLAIRDEKKIIFGLIDIDNFKQYNQTHGHLAGDDALVQIAQILSTVFSGANDIVGRYGGEEFTLLLPDTSLAQVVQMCEEFLHLVEERLSNLSLSIGLTCLFPNQTQDIPKEVFSNQLITQSEKALFAAKANAKTSITVYNDLLLQQPDD